MKIKNELPWFMFYCNDFLAKTRSLTTEQVGALILLDAYFWENGPIPNNPDVFNRIAGNVDASQVVEQFFQIDTDGRLFDPYMVELREAAIESANKKRELTKNASKARWKHRNGEATDKFSVTQNSSVTETDTESDTDTYSDSNSHLDPEPKSSGSSVTGGFVQKYGGRTTNGATSPPSGPGSPQTSVTDASQLKPVLVVKLKDGQTKNYAVSPETIEGLKARFPAVDVGRMLADLSGLNYPGEIFPSASHVKQFLETTGERTQAEGVAA